MSHNDGHTYRTVVVAVAINLAITLAKAVAAVLTGSPALWAETAHSVADTGNEILLLVGVRRSERPADARHPFGYGQERWFWTFLAALGLFVVGGVLSVAKGIDALAHRSPVQDVGVGVAVLAGSIVLEAISWRTAHRQLRAEATARSRTLAQHLARGSDPTAATVFLEDTAALIGLGLALPALVLHAVTHPQGRRPTRPGARRPGIRAARRPAGRRDDQRRGNHPRPAARSHRPRHHTGVGHATGVIPSANGPNARMRMKSSTLKTTTLAVVRPTNSGRCVGSVPTVTTPRRCAAKLPASATTNTIGRYRPSSITTASSGL